MPFPVTKGVTMPAVDCSFGTCRSTATHRIRVTIQGGRAAGEKIAMWVCQRHTNEAQRMAPSLKRSGLLERVRWFVAPS
jgi:hypothetical protein